ncbi:hypothetical protein THALO_60004 [Tenacibaculum halocynthiae]
MGEREIDRTYKRNNNKKLLTFYFTTLNLHAYLCQLCNLT